MMGPVAGEWSWACPVTAPQRSAPPSEPRVLIADDDPRARDLLEHLARGSGYVPVLARDGAHALARMDDSIAVALLDLYMPGRAAMDCLAEIRRGHPDAQVVVIAAAGGVDDAARALEIGAFHYVVKPFVPDDVVSLLRQAARVSALLRENRNLRAVLATRGPPSLAGLTLEQLERRALVETLRACGGNKAATARSLGVSEKTVYNKLKRLG